MKTHMVSGAMGGAVHVLSAFVAMGRWAMFANRASDTPEPAALYNFSLWKAGRQ
jgi:hypothetical protein